MNRIWNDRFSRDTHDEQARARLRRKVNGVDHDSTQQIALFCDGQGDLLKVFAVVRSERAVDVLQHNRARLAALQLQRLHQVPEPPERAAAFAGQATPVPGKRQVLARE